MLQGTELNAPPGELATHRFCVSDDPERFRRVGGAFLGARVSEAEVVTLGTA